MSALIDIPFPEDCNHCLICSLIPELPKRELREKGIQYRLYCKVTGECVSGVGRGEDCPLHECKTGKWIPCSERLPEDEYVLISTKPTKRGKSDALNRR